MPATASTPGQRYLASLCRLAKGKFALIEPTGNSTSPNSAGAAAASLAVEEMLARYDGERIVNCESSLQTDDFTQEAEVTHPCDNGLLGFLGQTEDERRKKVAWGNAHPTSNSSYSVDCDGRTICWAEYGKTTTCGWEIDHATPTAFGGVDAYANLRARHWQGNRSAGGLLGGLFKLGNSRGLLGGLSKLGNSDGQL